VTVIKKAVASRGKDQAPPVSKIPPLKRKRIAKSKSNDQDSETVPPVLLKKKRAKKNDAFARVSYTVPTILSTWDDAWEYGISFRTLSSDEQDNEVKRLNKVTLKGHKDVMKQKILDVNYKTILTEKMRAHLAGSRSSLVAMFHTAPKRHSVQLTDPNFLSVGEWVEVDGDITPGFNSEGGIAVIINIMDNCADVKYVIPLCPSDLVRWCILSSYTISFYRYVLTKWVEKLVPMRRLTTIVMPHRGARAALRPAKTAVVD
jgi:hypothetical protein